jgi:hypothetical protein
MLKPPLDGNYRYEDLWTSGPGQLAVDKLARALALLQEEAVRRGPSTNKGSGNTYAVLNPEKVPVSIAI